MCLAVPAKVIEVDIMKDYIDHLLTYVDMSALKPLKIVVNSGNGAAGPAIDELEKRLPFNFIKVNNNPDGTFPNGVPNPLLMENREATAKVVREEKADLGVAFDGDFDRCFIFDENGDMIEGYYIVGFLAKAFLNKNPGAKIIYGIQLNLLKKLAVDLLCVRAVMHLLKIACAKKMLFMAAKCLHITISKISPSAIAV